MSIELFSTFYPENEKLSKLASLLLRIAKTKNLIDAYNYWKIQHEIDISSDPWISNPLNMDVSILELFSNIKIIKSDYQPLLNLDKLINLEVLYCKKNFNNNMLNNIIKLPKLVELYIDESDNIDYNNLSNLINLNKLSLNKSKIKDICFVENLINLTYLSLNENEIYKINCLEKLINLQELFLNSNIIDDIANLFKLKMLKKLSLNNNAIDNIDSIEYLRNLTELDLKKNKVKSLASLKNLYNLSKLGIANNAIYEDEIERIPRSISIY